MHVFKHHTGTITLLVINEINYRNTDIYDFDHIDVFAKNQASIEGITVMIAEQFSESQIHIVTDGNDYRKEF